MWLRATEKNAGRPAGLSCRSVPSFTYDQAFFFRRSAKLEKQRETRRSVVGQSGEKKVRLIHLLHELSDVSPESGLLSDWSKNRRVFDRFV